MQVLYFVTFNTLNLVSVYLRYLLKVKCLVQIMVFWVAIKYSGTVDMSILEEHADSVYYDTLVSIGNAA